MNKAYLLIGGNMGDRKGFLAKAGEAIAANCGRLLQRSALYQTAAWGLEAQAPFLNQALAIETSLQPQPFLETVLSIEKNLGRERDVKYGPRVIDIDILLWNNAIVHKANLVIPHPQLHNRRFALAPLAEIAPDYCHPVFQKSIRELLAECPDTLDVHKIS